MLSTPVREDAWRAGGPRGGGGRLSSSQEDRPVHVSNGRTFTGSFLSLFFLFFLSFKLIYLSVSFYFVVLVKKNKFFS